MLKYTFQHVPSVGEKLEKHLWRNGILQWEDYLNSYEKIKLPYNIHRNMEIFLNKSIDALNNNDVLFFERFLPAKELWRIYSEFMNNCVFLDIETAGKNGRQDFISTISMYNGKNIKTYVKGINLDAFPRDIEKYSLIITYNGKLFDIPFILHTFKHLHLKSAHIDLRPILQRLHLKGGLKAIEKIVGIRRPKFLRKIDGYHAILLWEKYQKGDSRALDGLILYNQEDASNLHFLMHYAYNKLIALFPLPTEKLPLPQKPQLIKVDPSVYFEIRNPHHR
ncbi:MAG: hypothetical protein A2Y62_15365 [Candidatus Fischerbacteria bacterium RBG_13_37_8]|uniref:YprB ribonuclease H-like domain-containing protein n=1 Tax=Candidatus Fischerbacteria bacterium RBG_13_37_8 TaxID=1817863 RepID=A0A1F5VKU4_9BACT|nr:MAG: hypothetical protein A2Y62_15365 [Candidatus Fischerbacteria bacterium RBG_13_37_8]